MARCEKNVLMRQRAPGGQRLGGIAGGTAAANSSVNRSDGPRHVQAMGNCFRLEGTSAWEDRAGWARSEAVPPLSTCGGPVHREKNIGNIRETPNRSKK